MQIVSDGGMDLTPEQREGLNINIAPLWLTLDGITYRSGVDIQPNEFYRLLGQSKDCPLTSQPSAGDFADLYRRLAAKDPEILSIHISSGLSGTIHAAMAGAKMVPEAHVTFHDSKTLSAAEGWQVEAAARAAQAGWPAEQILPLLETISRLTETIYTVLTLKYLIHGGRISHMKGLIASLLSIKPIIGVEKERGTYVQLGQGRTLRQALEKMRDLMLMRFKPGSNVRIQVLHGDNEEGAATMHSMLESVFNCSWLPCSTIAPVLGAHTGIGLVGVAFAPLYTYPTLP
jgi:DegV family protein with EDD domain